MTNSKSEAEQALIAGESVAQTFSAAKAEMTQIEVNLWSREIQRLGAARVLSFVEFWIGGGAQGSFRRAPTIEDLLSYADPDFISPAQSLELLRSHVASCGPWSNPKIADQKMMEAIAHMGGWAKVCQDMPDPSDDFAYKRFGDRFRSAWSRSEALQVQRRLAPKPLLGLVADPNQLRLTAEAPEAEGTLPIPAGT